MTKFIKVTEIDKNTGEESIIYINTDSIVSVFAVSNKFSLYKPSMTSGIETTKDIEIVKETQEDIILLIEKAQKNPELERIGDYLHAIHGSLGKGYSRESIISKLEDISNNLKGLKK